MCFHASVCLYADIRNENAHPETQNQRCVLNPSSACQIRFSAHKHYLRLFQLQCLRIAGGSVGTKVRGRTKEVLGFESPKRLLPLWGPKTSCSMMPCALSSEVNLPDPKSFHPPPSSTYVTNGWSYSFTPPHALMAQTMKALFCQFLLIVVYYITSRSQ